MLIFVNELDLNLLGLAGEINFVSLTSFFGVFKLMKAKISLKIVRKYPKIVSSEDNAKHYFNNEWTLVRN